MSTLKTKIDKSEVISFLQNKIDPNISTLEILKGGEMSQAFSFVSKNELFVIRVSTVFYPFEKDMYAWKNFKSSKIPMPEILEIGELKEKLYFAISRKVEGQNFDTLPVEIQKSLVPQLIEIHEAVKSVQIPDGKFGYWNGEGVAASNTWRDFVVSYDDDIYGKWDELYKDTCLEKEVIEKVYAKLSELTSYLPEERFLVHGDFAGNNAVSDGKTITGILDWGESSYGDTLYDIAWNDFYFEYLNLGTAVKEYYKKSGVACKNFDERILCYKLRLGVGGLGFFAKSYQNDNYEHQKAKLLQLLSI